VVERSALAAILGVALGFLAASMLFLQWLTLIPRAIAAVVIGAMSESRRQAVAGGGIYGFLLGFTFTAFGYGGADPIVTRIPFFALLGAVSAVCGAALSLAGQSVISALRRLKRVDPRRRLIDVDRVPGARHRLKRFGGRLVSEVALGQWPKSRRASHRARAEIP
jgi:hypothetical protein